MKAPLLGLRFQNLPMEAELLEALRRILSSGQFIQGPEVGQFESAAAVITDFLESSA
jgi:dTDP-4-amino-4,6-dideoxygalactose transaminase